MRTRADTEKEAADSVRTRPEAAPRVPGGEPPRGDGWLKKYFEAGSGADRTVIELGCGTGDDTAFLAASGCGLICCDRARDALQCVAARHPQIATANFDLRETFPFANDTADIVVASLCLHFFDEPTLFGILAEIERVLKKGGRLLCRLNSTEDYIAGIPGETEIAKGAYLTRGGFKRFYDEDAIRSAFRDWHIETVMKTATIKFSKPKSLWELSLTPKRDAERDAPRA
ncbi:MAG: class I SAM-dependent methyltransferase [Clostridiales Family XIII bacterium]|jgi:ubiquinone/menaquinone biosynthesis C-methylase UbiE|nr:class I SAM-dependent methyltransferase [Clostridiales Family XIII bacterium]